jgi:hypothetical protein
MNMSDCRELLSNSTFMIDGMGPASEKNSLVRSSFWAPYDDEEAMEMDCS